MATPFKSPLKAGFAARMRGTTDGMDGEKLEWIPLGSIKDACVAFGLGIECTVGKDTGSN